MTLLNTLLVRVKRVILLQLLQSDRFPCFGSLKIRLVFQSSSMFSDIQISQKNFERIVKVRDFSGSTRSALMPFAPGALPFFTLLMALLISSIHGGSVLTSIRCVSARNCAVFSGSGRVKILWKCSSHHRSCLLRRIKLCPSHLPRAYQTNDMV